MYRLGLALLLATIGVAARAAGTIEDLPAANLLAVLAYVVCISGTMFVVRNRKEASVWVVVATISFDLLLVFSITYMVVPVHYYDRALLLAGAVIVLTEFHFGRALAWAALAATTVAYVLMVARAIGAGEGLSLGQELWSLGVFVVVSSYFITQYGSFRHRLATIVDLFERAEEGDFSGTYDVARDGRNDSVTMAGRAYNQMRAQLATMVLTDPLSGCLNRRGLEQQMAREIARVVRSGRELALIVLDVDYFKRINDTFGHLAGDGVIREVGALLRDAVRGADVVSRLGGDEFAVLLPDTNAAGAYKLGKRIHDSISHHPFHGVSGRVPITVSIGIVADQVPDEDVAHDLLSRADEALYAAKEGGRNRVSIWTPNLRAIAVQRAARKAVR
ncbi:MAG TPA: GGDEF domain-containing protein [Gemmatimonadaceae bacterium]|nr:GGDEF domain-containing protein [Gemmatimonadaceae bacterium]